MSISITLRAETGTVEPSGYTSLKVTAAAYGADSAIFAIERYPKSADPKARCVRFSHVCSPSELTDYPDSPAADCPYFRTSCIEMIFDDRPIADTVLRHIGEDVSKLVRQLKELDSQRPSVKILTFD